MYIIAGLGNPGLRYEGTRHNVGFHAVHVLEDRLGVRANRLRFSALTGEGRIGGHKVLLMKPQTYMNLSGKALREATTFYKIPPERVIVLYDDLDLPFGRLRVRPFGGPGTHNGMRSIVQELGGGDFPRVRIGIGEPTRLDCADFVLSKFAKEQEKEINALLVRAAEAAQAIVEIGVDAAMNRYNADPDGAR